MTEPTRYHCAVYAEDCLFAETDADHVRVHAWLDDNAPTWVALSPDDARSLADDIRAAADEAEREQPVVGQGLDL